jgi:hypothetical protein
MDPADTQKTLVEQAAEDLFNYAIEREDVKWLLGYLAPGAQVNPASLEYELQLLKIISVGWSIAYHLEGTPERKAALGEIFWGAVKDFARQLSTTTGLMIGQKIDYFQILKERLDHYVKTMQGNPEAPEPAVVIGAAFAGLCGRGDDIHATMAGTKMFANAVAHTRRYFEALKLR